MPMNSRLWEKEKSIFNCFMIILQPSLRTRNIMKNYLLTFLLFITFSAAIAQQTPAPRKSRFGIRVSPNVSWLATENKKIQPNGSGIGFSYGFMYDYSFNKNLAFSPGIDITTVNQNVIFNSPFVYKKTGANDSSFTGASYNLKNKYLEIPLLFTGKTNEIGYWTYFMQGGVSAGFLMKQKANIKNGPAADNDVLLGQSVNADYWSTSSDDVSFMRLGLVIGAGAEYNFGGTTSAIGAIRFNNGLNNVLKNQENRSNTNYISLSVGILF